MLRACSGHGSLLIKFMEYIIPSEATSRSAGQKRDTISSNPERLLQC